MIDLYQQKKYSDCYMISKIMNTIKKDPEISPTFVENVGCSDTETKKIIKPEIFLFDVEDDVKNTLVECGLNISSGTLGTPVHVPNKDRGSGHYCLLNGSIPNNLHEFDIAVVDIRDIEPMIFNFNEHNKAHVTGTSIPYILSQYPETVFDPRPFGAYLAKTFISDILDKGGLLIVFAGKNYTTTYQTIDVTEHGLIPQGSFKHSIYDFMPRLGGTGKKEGEKLFYPEGLHERFIFLKRNCENCRYHITFRHPYDHEIGGNSTHFLPLLLNSSYEIVAYFEAYENGGIIVLPDFDDKSLILKELLMTVMPDIYPELFPYHTKHQWIGEGPYHLPNEEKLIEKKEKLMSEFQRQMSEMDRKITENKMKFSWLHELLIKDDNELVICVQQFLTWLELGDVKYMDDDQRILEEDLQVDIPQGLLVIEVKGISGTSKDDDCSQISKIKYRRSEERGTFDVYALYIVNHQKHLPPLKRNNQPFTDEQISDAKNDKRGLLTTWQLFNLYFSIEAGGITKEEARKSLLDFGLVDFKPQQCEKLGKALNVLKNGSIVLFDTQTPISKSDTLVIMRDGRFYKAEILSMQSSENNVEYIESGEIGIKIDIPAKRPDIFYLRRT